MKKPTKTTLKRKLDKALSHKVRSRGYCVKCGNNDDSLLQCAHIFSRSNLSVRWDLDNVLCLCAGCHFWAHLNPVLFAEFVREYLGKQKYISLKQRASMVKKWTTDEMVELLGVLDDGKNN